MHRYPKIYIGCNNYNEFETKSSGSNQKAYLYNETLHYLKEEELHKWLKYNPAKIRLLAGKIDMDNNVT